MQTLDSVVVETGPSPVFSILWLHGLGADGHDFEPLVPELLEPGLPSLRFVFPHAPVRPVTLNNGYAMRAWYDIIGIDRRSAEDFAGMQATADSIRVLIEREAELGIPCERLLIAGFSQGGAMALHVATRSAHRFAGVVALSCYLPLANRLAADRHSANDATPIFMAHGTHDPVVPVSLGRESRDLLTAAGYPVEWHEYPMPHTVSEPEVRDLRAFVRRLALA